MDGIGDGGIGEDGSGTADGGGEGSGVTTIERPSLATDDLRDGCVELDWRLDRLDAWSPTVLGCRCASDAASCIDTYAGGGDSLS